MPMQFLRRGAVRFHGSIIREVVLKFARAREEEEVL
jgi:hypothetical protein